MEWKFRGVYLIPVLALVTLVAGGCSGSDSDESALGITYSTGIPDGNFDADGMLTTSAGDSKSSALTVAIQSDGKIVAAGYTGNVMSDDDRYFALVRYNVDGSLDNTFGEISGAVRTGKVTTSFQYGSRAYDVAILENGKILAAGTAGFTEYTSGYLALARYNTNGTLDDTFGEGGKVMASAGSMTSAEAVGIYYRKIMVVGSSDNNFAMTRYNADGTLDTAFGSNGLVTTSFGNEGSARACKVAIQSDGKVVAAGYIVKSGTPNSYYFALARYNAYGALDKTFGTNGTVTTLFENVDHACLTSLAIQADGKIVAAGYSGLISEYCFTLVRYNHNGTLDTDFGSNGIVTTAMDLSSATAIAVQEDGKIVAVGTENDGPVVLVRYDANGNLDRTFGLEGVVRTSIGVEDYDYAHDMSFDSAGGIVVVGSARPDPLSPEILFSVMRYK